MRTHQRTPRAMLRRIRRPNRRGATLIFSVFTMFVLFSFLAFSVDTGFLAGARSEMRRSADAASMAGCWEMYDQLRSGSSTSAAQSAARQAAADYALANRVANSTMAADPGPQSQEILVSYLSSISSQAISQHSDYPFLAVQVSLSKTSDRNGEVPFFFGKIFGKAGQSMQSTATSVMARAISGFRLPPGSQARLQVLPFALDEDSWNAILEGRGRDDYLYSEDRCGQSIRTGSDGQLEVNLYPQGTGSPGNRGTVDIGNNNNSTADIARQIVEGISECDLAEFGKPLTLDSYGTLTLNGDTGISAGVKDELASIIGQTRVIPIFRSVSANGNNATYTIVKWAAVRIMYVKLTGAMKDKKLLVQPASMIMQNVTASGSSQTSDGVYSPVVLVR